MAESKIEKTIKRVDEELSKAKDGSFFREHYISLKITISTYLILKNALHHHGANHFNDFKHQFASFYGMHRFTKGGNFYEQFFQKMEQMEKGTKYDVSKLAEELFDEEDSKIQFSFMTKLLNILNEYEYPIYDSNVANVFGIYPPANKERNERIRKYIANYTIIIETYEKLISQHTELILQFRDYFKVTNEELSDLRIMDFIIWKLGERITEKSTVTITV